LKSDNWRVDRVVYGTCLENKRV